MSGAALPTIGHYSLDSVAGQYTLAAIAVNLAALSSRRPGLALWTVFTTSTIGSPRWTMLHTHLPAAIALSGSGAVIPAARSVARNLSSVASACAGTAMPIMAARLVSVSSNLAMP